MKGKTSLNSCFINLVLSFDWLGKLYRAQIKRQNLEPRDIPINELHNPTTTKQGRVQRKLIFGVQPYFNHIKGRGIDPFPKKYVKKRRPTLPLPTRQHPFMIRVLNALLFDNSKLGTVGI